MVACAAIVDPHAESLVARLKRNPDDAEAYSALRAHYHRLGDYASLANLLEGWAARASDVSAAASAYFEAAELCEGYLDDRVRAISLLERSLEKNPMYLDSSVRLEEVFEATGDQRRLLDVLERRAKAFVDAGADPRHAAAIHQQMGEIWEQRLGRVDRAINHYRKAFELDSTLVTAIYAAREIYRSAGNLKAASSLYDLEVAAEADPKRKVALLREVAHMRAEQLGDTEGAITALKRAQTQAPTDLSVMHDLATVLLKRADTQGDAGSATLDRQKAADLLFQMAQSVPPDHGIAYAEAALDAAPDHDGALDLLERIAGDLGRADVLPVRWVAYLQVAPESPTTDRMRRRLGAAYVEADQLEDAIICYEPLLERGDAEAAESLVDLYRRAGRERDVVRALSVAVAGLPADKRIPRLREIISILVEHGELSEARDRAREILALDPANPEALAFLEDDCRSRGAWGELRDLLLAAGRVPGLSVDARKQRLREVASICEEKLEDLEGAISAWRACTALDPADGAARKRLAALLEHTERWDELVQVLEREALSLTDPDEKADVHRKLARIHRHCRQSLMEAVEAYRALREIRPGDDEARDEMCDTLIEAGAFLEAVPMMRQRIDGAVDSDERIELLARLAALLHEQVGDDEGAFETATRLLDEDPGNATALDRMERIDREAENWSRLLETLSYRTELAELDERAQIFVRMADIADRALGDLDRAAEYYAHAVDLSPTPETLDALCSVYDRANRYKDLVVLLRQRAKDETEPLARGELYRRIARTMRDRVRNDDAAAEAYIEVLTGGEDEEALRFLETHNDRIGDHGSRVEYLGRLAALVDDEDERRDLLMEKARVLTDHLEDDSEAMRVLSDVVTRVDPNHLGALAKLAALAEKLEEPKTLSMALERQLEITEDGGLRMPIARRLADLYENELDDAPRAIEALGHWADADLMEPEPLRRRARLLEAAGRIEELIQCLDALAGIEQNEAVTSELIQKAARLSVEHLGDVDGAWKRLSELAAEGDDDCELALRDLAKEVARGEQLAQFFVTLAQESTLESEQRRRWLDASEVLETYLNDSGRALEATLRAFATDLDDEAILDDVDRLAEAAGAWQRINQVYETLFKRADGTEAKVSLLMRQAHLLDAKAQDPGAALDLVLRACNLAPEDEDVLETAEELAPRAGRAEELFVVYDRRRAKADDDAGRVEALLRGAKLADVGMKDRDRAMSMVQNAVLSSKTPELLLVIEAAVRELDDLRPELGEAAAVKALVAVYQGLAEKVAEDAPEVSAAMLRRAAGVCLEDLDDAQSGLKYLVRATTYAPGDEQILDELEQVSEHAGRLDAFQKHLDKLVQEALDQATAAALLKRRGRILEVELERYGEAADVFTRLMSLKRHDPEVPPRLKNCLRKSGRHQDLLMALEREADRADDTILKVDLYKDVARVWEEDLGNKWEAIDAWKRVLKEDPDDEEATEAVQRLGHSTRRLSTAELSDVAGMGKSHDDTGEVDVPQPGSAAPFEEDPSGDFTSPALLAPSSEPAAEFDDHTETTGDDFLDELGPSERRRMDMDEVVANEGMDEDALGQTLDESEPMVLAPPVSVDRLIVPGDPQGFADFGTEESTMTGSDDGSEQEPREVTNELDISEVDEIEEDDDETAVGSDLEPISLDTGEIDVARIDTGDILIEEDSIQELDGDELLEELDSAELAPQPTRSVPPPPPPSVSRPPPPPPRGGASSMPPPIPVGKKDD